MMILVLTLLIAIVPPPVGDVQTPPTVDCSEPDAPCTTTEDDPAVLYINAWDAGIVSLCTTDEVLSVNEAGEQVCVPMNRRESSAEVTSNEGVEGESVDLALLAVLALIGWLVTIELRIQGGYHR